MRCYHHYRDKALRLVWDKQAKENPAIAVDIKRQQSNAANEYKKRQKQREEKAEQAKKLAEANLEDMDIQT